MTRQKKEYWVARYSLPYPDGRRGISASTDIDCLPATMIRPERILAFNKKEAIRLYREGE